MSGMQNFQTFRQAARLGAYAEYPMLPATFDPQHHLSRNDVAQPFYLICEKDSVVAQMSGRGRLFLRDSSVRYYDLVPGDWVYVPAGTPTRYVPNEESVQYRLRARLPGLEAVAFFADDDNGPELFRHVWDAEAALSQEEYQRACEIYNGDPALRRDPRDGRELPLVDVSAFGWADAARSIQDERAQSVSA